MWPGSTAEKDDLRWGLPPSRVSIPQVHKVLVHSLLQELCWTHSIHQVENFILNARQHDAPWGWKVLGGAWGWGCASDPGEMSSSSCEGALMGGPEGVGLWQDVLNTPQIPQCHKNCEAPSAAPWRRCKSGCRSARGTQRKREDSWGCF